jgi:GAF domain-containing protein
VGLFLLDKSEEWAILRAGTGEAGKAMLARGHKIKVGSGMIGWSVANNKARVALDVGQDAVRLQTLELPETRSEAALPLHSRGHIIGALTVQSDKPAAFDEVAISVLQTMADQVAVALDNAHLFEESKAALESARNAYSALTREAWNKLLESPSKMNYRCNEYGVKPVLEDNLSGFESDPQILSLPIVVRGEILGMINAQKPPHQGEWTVEEKAMVKTLTDQLAVALENARLYSSTQRQAQRERLITEITSKVRASTSLDTILQTAVQELAQALHIPAGSITLRGMNGDKANE